MTRDSLASAFARYRSSPTQDRLAGLIAEAARYAAPMRRTFPPGNRIDGDRFDDAVVDTALKLARQADSIKPEDFAGTFRQAVRNAMVGQAARIRRRKDNVSYNGMAEEEIFGREAPIQTDIEAIRAKIDRAVSRCPPEAVKAWRDHADGMRLGEIAEREGVPENTVKSRIKAVYRALRSNPALERELAEYAPGELQGLSLGR